MNEVIPMNEVTTISLPYRKRFALRIEFSGGHDLDQALDYMTEEQKSTTLAELDNYSLYHFDARVIASKAGVDLGYSHLGGNIYESYQDFIENGGHIEHMQAEATAGAEIALARLIVELKS